MASTSSHALTGRNIAAWFCCCPLLAIAVSWQIGLTLAIGLLTCVILTAGTLAILHGSVGNVLRLPLGVLVAGTFAVLEHLTLAAWRPSLDAEVAPWLVLVAGLAVLVCSLPEDSDGDWNLVRRMKFGLALSAALLVIGVARDGFGRVFLLANTPVGVLVLLALLLAGVNFVTRGSMDALHLPALSPLDSGLRRNDEQKQNAASLQPGDRQLTSNAP
jgi:Na+-translocating ferredoxin:NAD+ oxidoreductase RnfE subunit